MAASVDDCRYDWLPPFMRASVNDCLCTVFYLCVPVCMTASINGCLYKCSVLQSGFEDCLKRHWLGANYDRPGTLHPELN